VLFQSDLFSKSSPKWVKVNKDLLGTLDDALLALPKWFHPLEAFPEESGALGINSNNFRLHTSSGIFLLKRWSEKATYKNLQSILAIMNWLASLKLPVPQPIELYKSNFLIKSNSRFWSVFPFIEGKYFSGIGNELFAAAETTGRIMQSLSILPKSLMPMEAPRQMTNSDGKILYKFKERSGDWEVMLGKEQAELLALWWPVLIEEWRKINSMNLESGPIQAAHFDLHPHNILTREGQIVAVLDFEDCKVMPVGFALGFAALKQCRQTLALNMMTEDPRSVGMSYLSHLTYTYSGCRALTDNIGNLAISEVLRRICFILRLNLEMGEKKWNNVLPIQLSHLGEARALFG
jgi:aminoglycoside phosphotransferase (APT) family kinase protein